MPTGIIETMNTITATTASSSGSWVRFHAVVGTVLAEWGQPCTRADDKLTAALQELYEAVLEFPAGWPPARRRRFITDHADMASTELGTVFDDLIDTVINEYALSYGVMPHSEDQCELVDEARRQALAEYLDDQLSWQLPEAIATAAAEDPGRGGGSMTACGRSRRRRHPRPLTAIWAHKHTNDC